MGRALGAEVEQVGMVGGPTKTRVRFHFRGVLCELNLVPWPGGYVKFRTKGGDELSPGFYDLHPARRLLIVAAGSLAFIAVALVCLGPVRGLFSVWQGFGQIVQGGLAPTKIGVPLVRALFGWIRLRSFPTALGILAAKMAAFNLLPLPPGRLELP